MSDAAISGVSHSSAPKVNKDLENAQVGGAYMANAIPQQHVFGDPGAQLTDKQRNISLFC